MKKRIEMIENISNNIEKYICKICKDLLYKPVQCSECTELICYECNQKEILKKNPLCIHSTNENFKIIIPIIEINELENYKISFYNATTGFIETIKYKDYENNIKLNINCLKCDEEISNKLIDIQEHLDNYCAMREKICPFNPCKTVYFYKNTNSHLLECKFIPSCQCKKCEIEKIKNEMKINLIYDKLSEQKKEFETKNLYLEDLFTNKFNEIQNKFNVDNALTKNETNQKINDKYKKILELESLIDLHKENFLQYKIDNNKIFDEKKNFEIKIENEFKIIKNKFNNDLYEIKNENQNFNNNILKNESDLETKLNNQSKSLLDFKNVFKNFETHIINKLNDIMNNQKEKEKKNFNELNNYKN